MKEKKYSFLKVSFWYIISNLLVKGVSFFVLPVFTNLMSPEEYGIYSVFTSYLAIFEALILFGLSSTIRLAKYTTHIDYDRYISTILVIPSFITLILMTFINIYVAVIGELLSMDIVIWDCLLVTALSSAISNIILAKLVIDGTYKLYIIYSVLHTILNISLSILLCYTIYRDYNVHIVRLFGGVISAVISGGLLVFFAKTIHKINFQYFKIAIKWGVPLLLHTFATVVLMQSDRIIINYMSGYALAGIYSIAVTFVAIPLTIYTSIENAWAPWFYNNLAQKKYNDIKKFNNVYLFAFFLIVCAFMIVSPDLIRLFTNEDYWDSIYSLTPLSMSVFFELMYGICVNVEYFYKKNWIITLGTVIAIFINITLDIVFIYLFGYIGAAYATVISKMALFIIHYLFTLRIDKNRVFNLSLVLLLVFLMCCVDIYVVIFSANIIARVVMLCLFAVAIIILFKFKGKEIISTLKS